MIKKLFITMLLVSTVLIAFSQNQIYFQHQEKPARHIKINQKKQYTIITKDTILYGYLLLTINKEELTIVNKETGDEMNLQVSDLQTLKREYKYGFFGVLAYTGMIMLSITPVVWAVEGGDEALGTLEAAAGLFSISVPFIVAAKLMGKRDLKNKWKLIQK